jgi:hypothetical protein
MPQVMSAVVLSAGVRWGPVSTGVNGTLVARPVRMTMALAWRQRDQLG